MCDSIGMFLSCTALRVAYQDISATMNLYAALMRDGPLHGPEQRTRAELFRSIDALLRNASLYMHIVSTFIQQYSRTRLEAVPRNDPSLSQLRVVIETDLARRTSRRQRDTTGLRRRRHTRSNSTDPVTRTNRRRQSVTAIVRAQDTL